jgi:putative FmdB family regulatory protein
MPTYEYQCRQCGFETEELQSMSEAPLTRCPRCNTDNLVRILGGGAGLIFKGTGFYLTDYKKGSASPSGLTKKQEKKPEGQQGDAKASDDTTPAGKKTEQKNSDEKKTGTTEPPKPAGGPAKQ